MQYDIIIGAAPGGIFSAYEQKRPRLKIAVLEAGSFLSGRKCSIGGNAPVPS